MIDTPRQGPAHVAASAAVPSIRSVIPSLIFDGLCPFFTYKVFRSYVPSVSEIGAIGIGALFPLVHGIISIWRRQRVDIIGAIVLVGIGVSIGALLVGGSPRLFLIRESFVTGALGLVALVSLAWRRPLLFYVTITIRSANSPSQPIAHTRVMMRNTRRAGARSQRLLKRSIASVLS